MGNERQKLIVYILLVAITLAVFWQVCQFNFVNLDDNVYVAKNPHIKSGLSIDGIRWAFSTTYAEFWHPLTWLSLMLDYQFYGLNPCGYHLTNLFLHILSTLLLFWLFCRMTGAIWRSAFVAALFAIHPMHVESVAWISERKDVLSAFFWMLTLCLYVYYTEKPAVKRYLLVLFSFACALMSKSMAVTLPVIMILLDYWPLKRFALKKEKYFLWQLKEKLLFFLLSAIFSIITIFVQHTSVPINFQYSPSSRMANALVPFVAYLGKTFWPGNLAASYPYLERIPAIQVIAASLLIVIISIASIRAAKRLPYLFVGWLWYACAIFPVIGIIPRGFNTMGDHFTYLPLIGIFIMLAWGMMDLIKSREIRIFILLPAVMVLILTLSLLSRHQTSYWKNSIELFGHAVKVTKNNFIAHNIYGNALSEQGKTHEAIEHYNTAIRISPFYRTYNDRGVVYGKTGRFASALDDLNKAINLKPDYATAYNNRGIVYGELGRYDLAIEDTSKAIRLKPDYVDAFYNRGYFYNKLGKYRLAIDDYNKAVTLNNNYMP